MKQKLETVQNYTANTANNFLVSESLEGGLNITELKNILLRKIPLIAGCTLGLTSLALLRILTAPPMYEAGFELLSEPVNIETKVTSTNEDSRKTREEISNVNLDEVQLKILKSPKLILRIVETLKPEYPDLNYTDLISDLSIEIISDSQEEQNILQVIYQNSDKQKVIDVANALAKIYQSYSVEKRQSGVKRGIAFLDQQIPQIYTQAKQLETQITQLRTQYSFNNPDASLEQITTRINQLDQRREENSLKLQELKQNLRNLDQELVIRPANLTSATDFTTPRYVELLSRLHKLDLEINQKSAVFADKSETIQVLKREKQQLNSLIDEAGKDIRRKLLNQIAVFENRQQNLTVETDNLKTQLKQWSEISGEYNSLQHQLNIANSKLNEFTSQKDALQIDAVQKDSPWQLLTPPQKPVTKGISAINYLLLGSTLGSFLGVGLAFLIDKQQNIIYSSAKVEEITDLPILAAISHCPKPRQLSLLKKINYQKEVKQLASQNTALKKQYQPSLEFFTPSIEAFRSLAANIGLLNFNNDFKNEDSNAGLRSVVVTSAISGEGKSTVALNLARATASIGKRVLVVDADLRSNKNLTYNLGYESEIGLRNILEQNILQSGLDHIQTLPLEENLFILTSGFDNFSEEFTNKDSSRLLASVKMHALMNELQKQFDLVIYDLCSVIGFADVNLLASKTDGIVVVTGLGRIQTMTFNEALNYLKLCDASVMGVVLNKLVNKN